MKKIRLLSLALALLIVISTFTACNNNTSNSDSDKTKVQSSASDETSSSTIQTKDEHLAKYFSHIDDSKYNLTTGTSAVQNMYIYNLKDPLDPNFDYSIVVNAETKIVLNQTIASELLNNGWEATLGNPDETMDVGESVGFYIKNKDNKHLMITVSNLTEKESITARDCTITDVRIGYGKSKYNITGTTPAYDISEASSFSVLNQITNDTSLDDIVRQCGYPTTIGIFENIENGTSYTRLTISYGHIENVPIEFTLTYEYSDDFSGLRQLEYNYPY